MTSIQKFSVFRLALMAMAVSMAFSAGSAAQTYSNPVLRRDCPDPTILDDRERSGYFYLYSTQSQRDGNAIASRDASADEPEDIISLPIYRSRNLTEWEFVGDGFAEGRPEWVRNTRIWAPDINYVDGKYMLYYALGAWAQIFREGSGVAVSDSPCGPFTDLGEVVSFKSTGVTNSIDPALFIDDDGQKYLFWGSLGPGSGIWAVKLDPSGLKPAEGARKKKLGASNMEGAYVFKRDGWYYLFTSKGTCCNHEKSTYRLAVARSRNVFGPYVGPDGKRLTSGGFDNIIMEGNGEFVGTGHCTQIISDDSGQQWMAYHSYWEGNGHINRCLCIDRIGWTEDGWPYFPDASGSPDEAAVAHPGVGVPAPVILR